MHHGWIITQQAPGPEPLRFHRAQTDTQKTKQTQMTQNPWQTTKTRKEGVKQEAIEETHNTTVTLKTIKRRREEP